jgi:hypothetical protein
VEIVTAHDDDDQASQEYFHSKRWLSLIDQYQSTAQTLCCPQWGYSKLNHYYTTMALQAKGQWLMIWNDDAVMLTNGWDQHLADNQDFMGMLHMTTENFKPTIGADFSNKEI